MYLKINDIEMSCEKGEKWERLLQRLPDEGRGALGISVRGRTFSLAETAEEYAYARVLTYKNEEGRRIYERSLQLLFLTAVRRAYPGAHARIEHSFGQGLFIRLENMPVNDESIRHIRKQMREMADANLPFRKTLVSTNEAKQYFEKTEQLDRLRTLQYRKFDYFTLYEIDGFQDYFYGVMVPSSGYVRVFDLTAYDENGVVLMMPDVQNPDQPAAFRDMPKLAHTFSESARWQEILNCQNAADLNEMIRSHRFREFIRVNEALQERRIEEIAEKFIESGARVMLIAGPSSSGKTTFAHRMAIALRVHGLRPVKLSLDDYYLNRDTLPIEPDGSVDLEKLDTLDVELLGKHLPMLLAGETVGMPEFDFVTGTRKAETHEMRVEPGQPIIIEGIHGLNDALTATVDKKDKFKIYISALTMLNLDDHNRIRTTDARLLRRIVRDYQFRGTLPEETMALWASVRRGEEKYIFPYQENADAMFNSSLVYELPIMKKYAYPLLCAVQPESSYYTLANRLIKFLNYILVADVEDEIPVNSILREFIGGCCFYREKD